MNPNELAESHIAALEKLFLEMKKEIIKTKASKIQPITVWI